MTIAALIEGHEAVKRAARILEEVRERRDSIARQLDAARAELAQAETRAVAAIASGQKPPSLTALHARVAETRSRVNIADRAYSEALEHLNESLAEAATEILSELESEYRAAIDELDQALDDVRVKSQEVKRLFEQLTSGGALLVPALFWRDFHPGLSGECRFYTWRKAAQAFLQSPSPEAPRPAHQEQTVAVRFLKDYVESFFQGKTDYSYTKDEVASVSAEEAEILVHQGYAERVHP
jgi:multidrug efflux pump subunit AcrA (membrane-fusion protein)